MVYVYDNAIGDDLRRSFNNDNVDTPVVKVVDPESVIDLAAQIQNDQVTFPIIALTRSEDYSIDTNLTNFTRMHKGVATVIDPNTNELYYEKVVPIKLSYALTVLTTNTADMDEIVKELIFKYTDMYFLQITLPYECRRQVRFGVIIEKDANIQRSSGTGDYLKEGKLHQTIIPLKCEGTVLVSYTPAKLKRVQTEVETLLPGSRL